MRTKFSLAESAKESIKKFQARKCNYIRFRINFTAEKVEKDYSTFIDFPDNLSSTIPLLSSSVNLYRFNFDGKDYNLMIFCRIKDKDFMNMTKDQFKLSLLYKIDQMELKIHESLEIDHGLQLDEQFLIDHVISQRKSNTQWMISVVFVVLSLFGIAIITRMPKLNTSVCSCSWDIFDE